MQEKNAAKGSRNQLRDSLIMQQGLREYPESPVSRFNRTLAGRIEL